MQQSQNISRYNDDCSRDNRFLTTWQQIVESLTKRYASLTKQTKKSDMLAAMRIDDVRKSDEYKVMSTIMQGSKDSAKIPSIWLQQLA